MFVAVDGPALRNETTKFTNWVVATGSGLPAKETTVRSACGVGVGVGEGVGVELESALVKVAVSRSKSS